MSPAKPPAAQRRSPRQSRSRATWEAIVEAAAQILERRGPAALNTNAIAERAGVSVGSLYQYFPDKHAVLAAAARRELEALEGPRVARQKAVLEALIAAIGALGRLGETPAPAPERVERPGRPTARRTVRPSDFTERAVAWLAWLLVPPQPAPLYVRVRSRPSRRP
jgi:AcrR family transcriptional regulator